MPGHLGPHGLASRRRGRVLLLVHRRLAGCGARPVPTPAFPPLPAPSAATRPRSLRAGFMGELVPPNRKALAVYPLFLFYTAIGWLILIAAKR